jgi:zinc transporter ZupT
VDVTRRDRKRILILVGSGCFAVAGGIVAAGALSAAYTPPGWEWGFPLAAGGAFLLVVGLAGSSWASGLPRVT